LHLLFGHDPTSLSASLGNFEKEDAGKNERKVDTANILNEKGEIRGTVIAT
jgi:hypothetical protein